jgi:tRNA threonylcarbamoyladenosine modification (KEOPS) complex Cgi121 subunit
MDIYVSGIKRLGPEDNDAAIVRVRMSDENQDLISADIQWYVENKDVKKYSTIEELEKAALERTKAFLIEAVAVIG